MLRKAYVFHAAIALQTAGDGAAQYPLHAHHHFLQHAVVRGAGERDMEIVILLRGFFGIVRGALHVGKALTQLRDFRVGRVLRRHRGDFRFDNFARLGQIRFHAFAEIYRPRKVL